MGKRAKRAQSFGGRRAVTLEDGREVAYYDPTEAVEEHAASRAQQITLGGLLVDRGERIDGALGLTAEGRVVAVPKQGQEEIFSNLKFPAVTEGSAADADGAMALARSYLESRGVGSGDFHSFTITTHYYLAPLGKQPCGWSFSFELVPLAALAPAPVCS